jgi:hypothetical protein
VGARILRACGTTPIAVERVIRTDATQIAWSFGDDNVAMSLPNRQFRRQDDRRDKKPVGIYGEADDA